ncbi:phosphonate C-P lyase system protein PhnG [Alkalihalobacillus alcalophilus ATCC 27647 = CGMCC 1.3604]|uniref:Phosphonate C-P lyase n=1 Tax=Alkalihalobacillus alcalophilus ATCC 27647 = CGMCC 1.3604 TaxID=1218173 RepID=A0A094WQE1_ALKAL|nr:phosphonate C-P lyase system protein PhnG [Alkalihalobacillus alcalophilus]KGA99036.1 phosphonate C-P lyase [Alkalihalobacillus alcalophilus ATCC 27647 = CGMCC 1.3604]MED1560680.1 phosphonate C-P lyase system protein PhnG [Alkalihalobacillus alcalophilus]THG89820.1 phosphonate C-P lyase system protein PhnG [Alkalihalobacillus alcalophilus ATCC 27647 = CGMCC 1.3604]
MKRRRRTKIFIEGEPILAREMAQELTDKYEWQQIVEPRIGLTMMKMRETAQKSLFYLGEVLMTEAKVEVQGTIGIGLVMGDRKGLAQQLAIIDAAYVLDLPETKNWNDKLLLEEKKIEKDRASMQQQLFDTKVNFEAMDID